ncbi:TetR/AcrR family transcriptional regulator [Nocardioides sp. TRM66260-LWL]|uniref:TetR/AcrR family transcriptional regulator n=1 Tax=Nocardioides sp. TRM66260-LWL TaxID=2874478 RepID=UPI001CC6245D|nr:TetR/AcrR family transcriptional regulator [Nocardioides sp. TRM66260-LWL]MBZ5735621.1 TetR/AcrR family transcriptional regulator [Nocardioides sp. TRM66260-LWL]
MSTARAYHHGNLRAALVDAGVQVVREHGAAGADAVALRDLARRVGVSHNAAYRHFADREELLGEIAGVGMTALTEAIAARLATLGEPDAVRAARLALREIGRGYVAFALADAGLFRLAFAAYPSLAGAPAMEPELEATVEASPFGQLNRALDALVEVGYLAPDARPGAEFTCWSLVHGLAMLFLEGPLQRLGPAERESIVEGALAAIDRGFGGTTGGAWPPLG